MALFLDFDGTLVPLRDDPAKVHLDESVRRRLGRLAGHPRVTVCLISGRRVADLRRHTNVPGVQCLGLHGWEKEDGAHPDGAGTEALEAARRALAEKLAGLPGIWIEPKGPVFAVHYRDASPSSVRAARARVRRTVQRFGSRLRLMKGKAIWEVLPRAVAGKGAAVQRVLAKLPAATLPFCLGDDTTDEAAFRALDGAGITVRVGPHRGSRARYWLRNPREVGKFLEKLEAEIA